jgi:hypothetical protein
MNNLTIEHLYQIIGQLEVKRQIVASQNEVLQAEVTRLKEQYEPESSEENVAGP